MYYKLHTQALKNPGQAPAWAGEDGRETTTADCSGTSASLKDDRRETTQSADLGLPVTRWS